LQNLRALTAAVLLVAIPGASPKLKADSNSTGEYEVKAAFMFHFAQFVDWPATAFKDEDAPLTYCTVGEDAFRGALDESVKGKHIGSRAIGVRHLKERESIEGCHVLFLAATLAGRERDDLTRANGLPVLTVGETEHFTQQGGIIGFCLEGKKVRFQINLDAAGQAQLKISAKLLSLAKTVVGTARGD
jgi:hypothetical protein